MKLPAVFLILLALATHTEAITKRKKYNVSSTAKSLRLHTTYTFLGNDIARPYDKYEFKDTISVHEIYARYTCRKCGVVLVSIQDLAGKPLCAPLVMNGTTGTVTANFSVNGRQLSAMQVAVESLDEKPGADLNLLLIAISPEETR